MRAIRNRLFATAALGVLAGCAVGPNYHKPETRAPAHFGEAGSSGIQADVPVNAVQLAHWWMVFRDPELESLMGRAIANNRDLKTAISRVRQARAERAIAAGGLLPEVAATGGYNRSRGSKNVKLPLSALGGGAPAAAGGTKASPSSSANVARSAAGADSAADGSAPSSQTTSVPPGGPNSPFGDGGLPGVTTNLYQAGFDAVWEADIFGGTRRAVEAASAQAAAAQDGEYGVQVTLMGEVATTYMQLRQAQQREAIARRNIDSQRKTWKIADDKFRQGVGSDAEAAQDLAQLKVSETSIAPLAAAQHMAQHAIAFLLGEDPTALAVELAVARPLPDLPDKTAIGMPAELLLRRPDIRQAERNLAAATAEVGVATAQLYPSFSITGTLGLDSSDLRHLPEWGSEYFSVAPGVSWPILDWSRLRAAIRVEDELKEQALLAYENSFSMALRDVEDALVQYQFEDDRHRGLVEAANQARRARDVTAQVYEHGLADETETLMAERAAFQAEDSLAQSDAALRIDLIALFKALGGGWTKR
jgi:NodT family efflux transporter outer membrane factor (OMF) lipoprotein